MIAGVAVAVLFCTAMVLVSPLQNVTGEIAARTRPNLFDLAVALFSALAGAYATIRGRAGTVVGVAIATIGPWKYSLDYAFDLAFRFNGLTGLAIALVVGIGGALLQLGLFYRPPAED